MDGYPSVGQIIAGRYRVDALLGEGGMGAVFRASDSQGSAFALKFPAPEIRSRPGMMSRFANEAVAASRIASEHAVHIFGVEATEDGTPFIVMELLQGTDLDQIIEAQAPVETARAVHFSLQILRALQVAHAAGVVHRDMKPANCFVLTHSGDNDFIKIIDFGITKLLGDDAANQTRTSVTMGTPAYMSPEQAKSAKAAEPRSDLYAVGVILYELLTKKRPYDGDSHNELVVKICTEPPLPIRMARPDLPADLAAVVEHALVKIPAGRYESAQAFARALAPFSDARSAAVLQRIEGGVQSSQLAAALAPTPLASSPGSPLGAPPASPGNRTAIMEPGAPFAPPPAAAPAGREPQRTVVADGPVAFAEPPAATPPPVMPPPVAVPAAPVYSESHARDGGGRGALFAILGVVGVALIFGGLYFGGVFGGSSAAQPAPTTAATSDEEGSDEPTKKKKKKSPDEPDEPEQPAVPTVADPTPTATKPATTKPTTTTTTTATTTTDAGAPKPSTSTPGTTTAPTIVLPPGFPFPSGTTAPTTAPTPTTTTPPPATTTPPPATTTTPTTTSPAPTFTVPVIKKPKIGGG